MKKSDFYYELPQSLIAQTPLEPRDSSKLLVYNRQNQQIQQKHFYDIIDYLNTGDVLVVNKTRVIPARIFGTKKSGARVEFLLCKRINYTDYEVLCRPAKRARTGDVFHFCDKLSGKIIGEGDEGARIVSFCFEGVFEDILSSIGSMPLPHYIHNQPSDPKRYQTVYAKQDGSSAAPTAGLHFTPELIDRIKQKGVAVVEVLLHVGLGTFRPVKSDDILQHKMHSEYYEIDQAAADTINAAKRANKKCFAVGTTSVRVLESAADEAGFLSKSKGDTNIFIYPPYKFKVVDSLITNFHLPESTLIMLVSAFCGTEQTLSFYDFAIKNNYRFFSFGDACLLL